MIPQYNTTEITLTRTIPAPPAEVYDAWLDPSHPGTPFNGAKKLILEQKVDGMFYFLHVTDTGTQIPHFGRFVALDRGRKVQQTWMSPVTRGLESVVTVTFEKKGEDTLLKLSHSNLPDDEVGRLHEGGWAHYLGLLEQHFAPAHR